MTPKQQRFIEEYLVDLNATQAAIRAGYSAKTAYSIGEENLKKPEIRDALKKARKQTTERTQITEDWVLNNLKAVAERCLQASPVLDKKGNPVMVETPTGETVPAFVFNSMGANRSLELLGKHIGMFGDKVKIEHSYEDMSDDELTALARSKGIAVGEDKDQGGAGKTG